MRSNISRQSALEKLGILLSRIGTLEHEKYTSEPFSKWRHDTRVVLKHVFPEEPDHIQEFDRIIFSTDPEGGDSTVFRRGLASARALIQSSMDEVVSFWDEAREEGIAAAAPRQPEIVFVIHGRQLLPAAHDFLRSLGLRPLEWSRARTMTRIPTPYTWQIVDTALQAAGAIMVLFTPDDEARLAQNLWSEHENAIEKDYLFQPRQNVLFEAGVAYGRAPERTVLVRVGSQRPMSDLAGHHIIQLDNSPQSRQAVADALRAAGCPVDLSGSDWYRAGDFAPTT